MVIPKLYSYRLLVAALAGVILMLARRYLPAGPDMVVHLAAVPLSVAYWCGRPTSSRISEGSYINGVTSGICGMLILTFSYYITLFMLGQSDTWPAILLRGVVAVIGGAFAGGVAGAGDNKRDLSAAFLGSIYIGEAVFFRNMWAAPWIIGYAALGLVLLFMAARRAKMRIIALALCVPGSIVIALIWCAIPLLHAYI